MILETADLEVVNKNNDFQDFIMKAIVRVRILPFAFIKPSLTRDQLGN